MHTGNQKTGALARLRATAFNSAFLRWNVVGILTIFGLAIAGTAPSASAGCDHPEIRVGSRGDVNPSGYARTIRFIGSWIYEAGEAKYVPWEGSTPCQGPNCGRDDSPGSDITANTSPSLRGFNDAGACSQHPPYEMPQSLDCNFYPQVVPLPGFPHDFEYPP